MKKTILTYTEPLTIVNDVVMEGFLCSSEVNVLVNRVEVDELVNTGEETWLLNKEGDELY